MEEKLSMKQHCQLPSKEENEVIEQNKRGDSSEMAYNGRLGYKQNGMK